jgi:hypothetical protein
MIVVEDGAGAVDDFLVALNNSSDIVGCFKLLCVNRMHNATSIFVINFRASSTKHF